MFGHHLRFRPRGSAILANTPEHRCLLVRAVLGMGRNVGLLSFGLADNHPHLQVASGDRRLVGRTAQRMQTSLTRSLGLGHGFESAYIEALRDQQHAYRLFDYILRQQLRHGLANNPLREMTNLHDLLGLRPWGAYTVLNVQQALPRVDREQLLQLLRLPDLLAAHEGTPEECALAGLRAAALPVLRGSSVEENNLRRAIVRACAVPTRVGRWPALLGCSARALRRTCETPPDPRLVQAIQLQGDLRRRLAAPDLAARNSF